MKDKDVRIYLEKDKRTSDDYISPSQIKTYLRCPYAFYLKYIIGLEPDYVPERVKKGTELHEKILYEREYNFIADPEFAIVEPIIEREVEVGKYKVLLRGLPDVISNSGIYDLKTTSSPKFLTFASYYDKIQMAVYSIITRFEYPTFIVKYYPITSGNGIPVSIVGTIPVVPTQKIVDKVNETIEKIVKLKRTFTLEDQPAGMKNPERCKECFFKNTCPFANYGRKDNNKNT